MQKSTQSKKKNKNQQTSFKCNLFWGEGERMLF